GDMKIAAREAIAMNVAGHHRGSAEHGINFLPVGLFGLSSCCRHRDGATYYHQCYDTTHDRLLVLEDHLPPTPLGPHVLVSLLNKRSALSHRIADTKLST